MPLPRPALHVLTVALLAAPAATAAPRPADRPQVSAAWARPTMGAAGMSAVYLDIRGGRRADRLVGASTPVAASLQLHRSQMSGGMAGMRPVDGIDVPAGAAVRLAPGGLHLMLMGAKRPLRVGDVVPVTLRFAHAGSVSVRAPVRATPPAR